MIDTSQGRSLPWFRVDVDLVDHPKVSQLAIELGVDEPVAGWLIIRLWSWTMRYAARGRLAPGARAALERACGWRGEPGRLVLGLVATGWLEDDGNNGYEVHDWSEHNGAAVAKAEKDAERKRGARAARAGRADGAGKDADRPARAAGNGTGRNGTERNNKDDPPPPPKPVERGPLVYAEPTTPSHTWSPEDFFRWAQAVRARLGHVGEKWPGKSLSTWWAEVTMTPGMEIHRQGVERLRAGFLRFARDPHWGSPDRKPAAPFNVFMLRWGDHVPPEIPGLTLEAS